MAEIRYGHREGPGKGREYPVLANSYFHRRGGKFVYLNAAGAASLCATDIGKVFGWLESPKDASGYNSWKSTSGDKCFIVYGADDVYELPALETSASIAASWCGMGAALETTGSTYTMIQGARVGGGVASPLSVIDVDTTNKTVFVKIRPSAKQAA